MWPKSCLFVLVFGSRYTPIPMCAHTFADFVPEKHFLTLNILIFLLFLFAHTHTHTHILRERFAAAATAVSVLSILFVCSIFGWGGGALEEFGCSLIILFSQPAPLFLRKSAKNLFRIFLWYTFTASGVHVCYSSHAPANFHTQSYIIFLVRVLFSPVFHLILSTRASTKCAYHVLCSAAFR